MKTRMTKGRLLVLVAVVALLLTGASVAAALTGDIPGTALPPVVGSGVVTDTVSVLGPADAVYSIDLNQGDKLSLSLTTTDTARLGLSLYDHSSVSIFGGIALKSSEGTTFPLAWSYTATQAGSLLSERQGNRGDGELQPHLSAPEGDEDHAQRTDECRVWRHRSADRAGGR